MLKHCNGCNNDLPLTAFYFNKTLNCYRSKCIQCLQLQHKNWRTANLATARRLGREKAQRSYYNDIDKSRRKSAADARRARHKLYTAIRDKLGGKCTCGVTDRRVLQIDHVHNGGSAHVRRVGQAKFLKAVLTDASGAYQLLCANCNWRKRLALLLPPKTADARKSQAYDTRKRTAAIDLLGGKCSRCGEADRTVLQFDHIHGNGRQDRKTTGRSHGIANDVLQHGNTKYQLLCANCNQVKRHEHREWPQKYEVAAC